MVYQKWEELEAYLKQTGAVMAIREVDRLGRPHVSLKGSTVRDTPDVYRLNRAFPYETDPEGFKVLLSDILVSKDLFAEMAALAQDENSSLRRMSTVPISRSFVYLDISDFSKMPSGMQLLVVHALVRLANEVQAGMGKAEAQLCIGDGYIYVWDSALGALRFAGNLARAIETAVADKTVPEFHFRAGAHVGPVRCFWDPGRNDWNYVGDGINGGNRVLSAIGKDTDDVVFVSGQLRTELQSTTLATHLLPHLHNRGRKADKHGKAWRVYELNHSAMGSF